MQIEKFKAMRHSYIWLYPLLITTVTMGLYIAIKFWIMIATS